jgi:hypothetical protein
MIDPTQAGIINMSAVLEFIAGEDIAKRGSAALALAQQLADAIASCENELEKKLQNVLADLTAAQDRNAVLSDRARGAEKRADEAEGWLRRLHDRLQHDFVPAKRHAVSA